MKSPITGKEMKLRFEIRELEFRKETFKVHYHYYLCEDTGEQFTTRELDELNIAQLYNQYREKHHLPFPEEIKSIREKYGLAANKMAEILGFGVNSYRHYESGEVPSQANARLIQMAADPAKFIDLVKVTEVLDEKKKKKLLHKVESLVEAEEANFFAMGFQDYLLGQHISDEYSGYKRPNLEKLAEMVVYFSAHVSPWKTQLNKLLFYADFLSFKTIGYSISGTRYCAINMGPVPNNFNSIFEFLAHRNDINIEMVPFPNGTEGERFLPNEKREFNPELFSERELAILKKVNERFKGVSTKEIIEISHRESAWKANVKDKRMISYKEFAFDLSLGFLRD